MITKEHIQKAKDKDMRTLLASHGYTPSYETSTVVAYKSMLPDRFESVPSFMLRRKDNKWMDYGYDNGKPHDTIDFITLYKGISFAEAVEYLIGDTVDINKFVAPPKKDKRSVQLEAVRDIISPWAYDYLSGRKISAHRARKILKEVDISFPYGQNPTRVYKLLGHYNDSSGLDLRNKFFKTVTVRPKDITTIKRANGSTSVFEGVIDYLAALEYFDIEQFRGDVIILNSCSFAGSIAPFFKGKKVYAFTDWDKSGQQVIDTLRENGVEVVDERHHYEGYNDFADLLVDKKL